MAKKTNVVNEVVTFTNADFVQLENCKTIIEECQRSAEGLAQTIAGQLYIVSQKELYRIEDYKNVHQWAMDKFDIAKGTVSDAINTFKRFGDGCTGLLLPEWQMYSFSTLMKMKGLTDEQIQMAGIDSTMSRTQVMQAIKGLQVLEEKESKLPQLEKRFTELYNEFMTAMPNMDDRRNFFDSIEPEFQSEESVAQGARVMVPQYEKIISAIEDYLSDTTSDIEEQSEEIEEQADEIEDKSSSTVEQPNSMPTDIIDISVFMGDNGKLKKKELLDFIWVRINDRVLTADADITITKLS